MAFVELLSKGLKNRNPQLDLQGSDRRVLHIAYQDLMNYLRFHWGLKGREVSKHDLMEKLQEYFHEKPEELEEFVGLWSGIWMRKWSERVKLLMGNEDSQRWKRIDELLSKAEPLWRQLRNRNEIEDMVIGVLIRNGEICGTSILAEDLLKIELGLFAERKVHVNEHEHLLSIVNNALRKARQLSQSKGPLIFVRIDKSFFQFLEYYS